MEILAVYIHKLGYYFKNNVRDTTNFTTKYLQTDMWCYVEGTTSTIKTPNYQLNINI